MPQYSNHDRTSYIRKSTFRPNVISHPHKRQRNTMKTAFESRNKSWGSIVVPRGGHQSVSELDYKFLDSAQFRRKMPWRISPKLQLTLAWIYPRGHRTARGRVALTWSRHFNQNSYFFWFLFIFLISILFKRMLDFKSLQCALKGTMSGILGTDVWWILFPSVTMLEIKVSQ
jgi:hypothetical protein